jgi:protein-S-isoprenylcysteine O-methyltransferase Ste14
MLIPLWCPPIMTPARLALAAGLTLYVLVGARLEERDLVRAFGDEYRAYQRRVPMILPYRRLRAWPRGSASS